MPSSPYSRSESKPSFLAHNSVFQQKGLQLANVYKQYKVNESRQYEKVDDLAIAKKIYKKTYKIRYDLS